MFRRRKDIERLLTKLEKGPLKKEELSEVEQGLIPELRTLGYRISIKRGRVSLISSPEIPYPWEVGRRLRGTPKKIFRNILFFPTINSTNTYLLERGDSLPSWTAVIADHQTSGRGRKGSKWFSPPGKNIYTSLLLRLSENENFNIASITLVTGIAVARTVEEAGLTGAGLKWPNDVTFRWRKLAGILTESRSVGEEMIVVVGIGINVNMRLSDFPAELQEIATSFRMETGQKASRASILALLYHNLYYCYDVFLKEGFAPFVEEYGKRSVLTGRVTEIRVENSSTLKGRVLGVDTDGALLLQREGGEVLRLYSGEVVKIHGVNY